MDLTNSLAEVNRLQSGAIEAHIRVFPVQPILRRLKETFSVHAQAGGLRLLIDECDDVVRTDPALLEKILRHLVTNAVERTRRGWVRVHCRGGLWRVRIEVRDTGVGIPENELEAVFDDFYQLPGKFRQISAGLGLGLSIVRRIALLLRLRLEVTSMEGWGSVFSVDVPKGSLPTTAAQRIGGRSQQSASEEAGPDNLALLVESYQPLADATALLLSTADYNVVVAAAGEEVESVLSQACRMPDVLICDYHLAAKATVAETIRKVRNAASHQTPAVILVEDICAMQRRMLEQIPDCYLVRMPPDADELLALLTGLPKKG